MHARWTALAAATTLTGSCIPIEQVPPPFFTPRPPYPPEQVIPGQMPYSSPSGPEDYPSPIEPQPQGNPSPPPSQPGSYPPARKTLDRNEVISPYPPHHRIDVTGFQSGQLARDPYTDKIFRIP